MKSSMRKRRVSIVGHKIHDHKKSGCSAFPEILAQSSDVGAIKIALRLGAPKFYEYIALRLRPADGIELPGESRGMLGKLGNWSGISIGAISMGQEVGVTPIQLVTAVSAIANGAICASPHCSEVRKGDQVASSGDHFATGTENGHPPEQRPLFAE